MSLLLKCVLLVCGIFGYICYVCLSDLSVCPDLDNNSYKHCYFSDDYWTARHRFINKATHIAQLTSLDIAIQGLTIDVAVIPGQQPTNTFIVVSGTHGVEGYAGSAIQLAYLDYLTQTRQKPLWTIVLVHALNPYGMNQWRRQNENNVDLNRNLILNASKFPQFSHINPDFRYIEEVTDLFAYYPSWLDLIRIMYHYLRVAFVLGFIRARDTTLIGQYHSSKSIFFGGTELQMSHKVLVDFFQEHGFIEQTKDVMLVDLHTGLGKMGVEYLGSVTGRLPNSLYEQFHDLNRFEAELNFTVFGSSERYVDIFKNAENVVAATLEIGTRISGVGGMILAIENAAHLYGWGEMRWYNWLNKYMFFPSDRSWKEFAVTKGLSCIQQFANIDHFP